MEKVRQVSQKEAGQIDVNNVDYFTLTDGTIIKIKKEGEESAGAQFQEQGQYINQNIQNSANDYQEQSQYQQSNEYQNNYESSSNAARQMQNQERNSKVILNPGGNYGYYMSNEAENVYQSQQNLESNYYQAQQDYLNYNAKLVDASICDYQIINQLQLKNLSLSGPQFFRYGPKRQLYKLVTAIPVRINNSTGTTLKSNTQVNLQQYNTYMANNYKNQELKQEAGMDYKEESNQNKTIQLKLGKNFSFNPKYGEEINEYEGEEYQNQNMEYNNNTGTQNICPTCNQ